MANESRRAQNTAFCDTVSERATIDEIMAAAARTKEGATSDLPRLLHCHSYKYDTSEGGRVGPFNGKREHKCICHGIRVRHMVDPYVAQQKVTKCSINSEKKYFL